MSAQMPLYRPVSIRLWDDKRFLELSDTGRSLWMFFLTSPSLPIPGVVLGGEATVAERMNGPRSVWTIERVREGVAELVDVDIKFRWEGRVIWCVNATKHQPIAGPNALKMMARFWGDLPDVSFKHDMWQALKIAAKRWSKQFSDLFPEPVRNPFPDPVRDPVPDPFPKGVETRTQQEHKQEQITELSPARACAIPAVPSTEHQPPAVGMSGNLERLLDRVWAYQREKHRARRAAGVTPHSPDPPSQPAHPVKLDMLTCAKQARELGHDDAAIESLMRHCVDVADAEAERDQDLKYFKSALLWEPRRFWRSVETSLPEARAPKTTRAGPGKPKREFGSADPRNDHPEGDRNLPFGEAK